VGPRAQRQRLTAVLFLVCSLAAGCGDDRQPDPGDAVSIAWTLEPAPPAVGAPIVVRMTLRDRDQRPVTGARLTLEGLMSHPGMAPVAAAVTERGNGEYDAPLQFTMAGDWILLVTGELPGDVPFKRQIEINGVRPAS
jgi:hypothetical protein